jgi:tyrosyl-tRNA synthetase
MDEGPVTFYVGCDPTGPSLHIGHMVPFFAYRHLRDAGHRGIALVGGGTARIGDPSGKSSMRQMLSYDQLDKNAASIARQLEPFLGFDGVNALTANNKDWLADLNYIDFLREIGSQFSVNRMLSFEAYKIRMETGLSFIEFNYQLLQSYDFLQLYRRHGCRLQIGGDDQWGNIVAGADLIRRLGGGEVFGLTFPLVTTSDGKKMGKTEKGAIFLDPSMTSPYDFFQYWRNIQDADIRKFLLMFTFLPVGECDSLTAAERNPNEAKERLAWEVTALIHGKTEADKALAGAKALFGGGGAGGNGDSGSTPTVTLEKAKFERGYNVVDLFFDAGLCDTKSDARRLIQQGGASKSEYARVEKEAVDIIDDKGPPLSIIEYTPIRDVDTVITTDWLVGGLILRAGKKRFCRVVAK